ncbi:selenium-dependent molybdenum cofactor biosynthesis protein YqeB [Desulfosediminicola ganghwensis]|uniref:selenium-dependent molybdenum cofactor biosynthesis protein YqeB n=1 Tax=Desulfosediminicola ganghwensis TaxID=2569540 RepID=UPI0010ACCE73|nr:selenium-dependent molybdenum cofactor biosynthesis protein YqeB [Desulfosediminicola ganghwensis]
MAQSPLIIVRGGGDIATGTICRLHNCGFRLLVLEVANPTAIRRTVSISETLQLGSHNVEGVKAERIERVADCERIWQNSRVPVIVDPNADCLGTLATQPSCIVDAILAKKNLGTTIDMAPITIGIGPGFTAGLDVHAVIETNRGHDLGRIIYTGSATANTSIPAEVGGFSKERVLYATQAGTFRLMRDIGSVVYQDELLAKIGNSPVIAPFTGLVRGILRDGTTVHKGLKIADIDPRLDELKNCWTISDKARSIGGSVLEAFLALQVRNTSL